MIGPATPVIQIIAASANAASWLSPIPEHAGIEHFVVIFVQRRSDMRVNRWPFAGRLGAIQLGAQRHTAGKKLQRIVDVAGPATEVAPMLDHATVDQLSRRSASAIEFSGSPTGPAMLAAEHSGPFFAHRMPTQEGPFRQCMSATGLLIACQRGMDAKPVPSCQRRLTLIILP